MRIPFVPSLASLAMSSPLILCGGLTAQGTATFATETDVGVFADAILDAAAKLTAIDAKTPLDLAATSATGSATAKASVLFEGDQIRGVHVQESAAVGDKVKGSAGTCATTDPKSITQGPHSYLLQLSGAQPSSLDVGMASKITGQPRASVAVDIGADGKPEFLHVADGKAYLERFPIPAGKVLVRITVNGSADQGTAYTMDVKVLTAGGTKVGCDLTPFGPTCPTSLGAADAPAGGEHVVTLKIGSALADAPIVVIVGLKQVKIPIPGTSCQFLTDPLVLIGAAADAKGDAQVVLKFSQTIPAQGYLQAIPYDAKKGVIVASNGIEVDCR